MKLIKFFFATQVSGNLAALFTIHHSQISNFSLQCYTKNQTNMSALNCSILLKKLLKKEFRLLLMFISKSLIKNSARTTSLRPLQIASSQIALFSLHIAFFDYNHYHH
jgi:hypothetical protein